jgi:hypothetical protein
LILRFRILRRVSVAESALSKRSLVKSKRSLIREDGADLAMTHNSISGDEPGRSRDTLLLDLIENFGIGNELGGGEFE